MKSWNLNFLELSGLLQACNGTALPLPLPHQLSRQNNYTVIPHVTKIIRSGITFVSRNLL